ncbi:MAG: uracil phosphoribosyltransferase [Gemmatimonadales bacterium]|jgi:uracil phosphoribosyltransferase
MTLAPAGPFARDTEHPNLLVTRHPLLQHKVSLLRSVDTSKKLFKELVDEIAQLLAYEVTADLATRPRTVETPLETMEGARVDGANIVVVPVLRAGLGMVEGILQLIPTARVGHIGLQRDHDTLEPADYYFKVPPGPEKSLHIVTDPMLATGGSASAGVSFLKGRGAKAIRLMVIVAAPEGVRRMASDHPDVPVYAAALDRELNERGYILPGLGDAGDRLFGTE